MRASVIFTTYNHPNWLEKVLWGFSIQTYRDIEIIVADDGSGEETRELIKRVSEEIDIPVVHIWHQDQGFQKCRILNKAILASKSEYLIFTDGDCIPHPEFVENHMLLAEKGHFLSGGYFKLPMDVSQMISKRDILEGNATRPGWLLKHGLKFNFRIAKLISNKKLGAVLDALTTTRATWNGHSASTWREYVIQVNGFDERMQYGGQDREFGERLMNMGIKGKQVRYRCSCVHLDHKRGYATKESIDKNKAIRRNTRKQKVIRTEYGIAELEK